MDTTLDPFDGQWSPEKIALYTAGSILVVGSLATVLYLATRGSAPAWNGVMVPGARIMSGFGPRRIGGREQYHLGEDIAAPAGTPIYMPVAGTVVKTWPDNVLGGYGNTVVVKLTDPQNTGKGLLFAHMQDYAVSAGQRLVPGDLVGHVGSTDSEGGFSRSDAHLHLEVFVTDNERDFSHFVGGANYRPNRQDPQEWALERGIRLS